MSLNHLTSVDDAVADKLNIGCNKLKSNKIQVQEVVLDNTDGSTTTLKLPDQGSAGYALKSNGSGSVFWSADQVSAGGIVYSGNQPANLNKFLKINATDGSSAVESSISENQIELNLNNLQIKNMTDPTDDQDAVTRKYLEDNPQNPFDQDLSTTSSVEFTNEVVVSNGVNNDNFYFKDEETKACIQHRVSGTRYNVVEALNNGEISIGDSNVPSTPDLNLYFDNVNMGSISLFNALNPLGAYIGTTANPYGNIWVNTLNIRSFDQTSPKINLEGNFGLERQVIQKSSSNELVWDFLPYDLTIAASDEVTPLTLGSKIKYHIVRNCQIVRWSASLTNPTTSGIIQVDILRNGTSVLSNNKLVISTGQTYSTNAQPTIFNFSDGDEFEIVVLNMGNATATGLKIYMKARII